jgi:hypothetical protein
VPFMAVTCAYRDKKVVFGAFVRLQL